MLLFGWSRLRFWVFHANMNGKLFIALQNKCLHHFIH